MTDEQGASLSPTSDLIEPASREQGLGSERAGVEDSGGVRVVRQRARQRRADRRRRRATSIVATLTVVFVLAAIALGVAGWQATLHITGGKQLKVTDPKAPGYTAEARPTEVQLLALVDESGGLGTMLMLIGGAGVTQPVVVPVSAGLVVWEFEDAGPIVTRDLFAEAGLDVVALRLGVDLSFGIESSAELPLAKLAPLFESIGPITTELPDIVYHLDSDGTRAIRYPAGELTLEPDQVAEFLSFTGDGEAELNRSLRVKPVWEKVLDAYRARPQLVETPSDVRKNVTMWAALAQTGSGPESKGSQEEGPSLQILPTKVIGLYTSPPVYLDQIDADAMPGWVSSFVPFPTPAFPGQRLVVNLLNGTKDPAALRKASPRIVSGGGSIGMTGNAASFDIDRTEVLYTNPAAEERARRIASELGAVATRTKILPSGVDVQVTVGKDML